MNLKVTPSCVKIKNVQFYLCFSLIINKIPIQYKGINQAFTNHKAVTGGEYDGGGQYF